MESRASRIRSRATLVVALLALVVSLLTFVQGGADKARANHSFQHRVEEAVKAMRLVVASSSKDCTTAVNQTSADACSVIPDNTIEGPDLEKNTVASREVGSLGIGEVSYALPTAYAEYSATHDPNGLRGYFLGSGTGFDDPGSPLSSDVWDSLATPNFNWEPCTAQTAGGTIVPCLKAPAAGSYQVQATTTFKGSTQGTRTLSLIVWKDDGTGIKKAYAAGGDDTFLTGVPASELPTSDGGSQQLTLNQALTLAKGEKFTVFVQSASGADPMTSLTSLVAVMY